MPHTRSTPGIVSAKNAPRTNALTITSRTDRPAIGASSRRKSIVGIERDAE
jgi:hypothetical protein